jgi:MFS transporter, ACS family, tartrate transporter
MPIKKIALCTFVSGGHTLQNSARETRGRTMEDVEKHVIGKVMWRLIPFLIVCYFVAYLDRVNVGFAKLHMNQALGLSEAAFGLGAGLFFVGYFLFEIPSNIFLERVGARVWIARIMITSGIVSAAFAFGRKNATP